MGRVTEFIYYINQDSEPTALVKATEYSHISFTEEVNQIGKDCRKKRKQERNNGSKNNK